MLSTADPSGGASSSPLPDDLRSALTSLTRGRTAAVRLDRVGPALGMPDAEAAEVLAALQAFDLVGVWPDGPGHRPHVVLTPRAAAWLGLELADGCGSGFRLRWVPRGKGIDPGPGSEPAISETDAATGSGMGGFLDSLPDPKAIGPAEAAAAGERPTDPEKCKAENGAIRMGVALPRITLVLGITATWPVVRQPGRPCPGCRGRKLPRHAYCAVDWCCRSGLDGQLPSVSSSERPKGYKPKASGLSGPTPEGKPKPPKLGGGRGPAGEAKDLPVPDPKRARKRKRVETTPARNSFDLSKL